MVDSFELKREFEMVPLSVKLVKDELLITSAYFNNDND